MKQLTRRCAGPAAQQLGGEHTTCPPSHPGSPTEREIEARMSARSQVRRPRGVYQCAGLSPETVVYIAYDSRGHLLGRVEVLTELDSPNIPSGIEAWLDTVDPMVGLRILP